MFDVLDLMPWERLSHAYGPATDAPKWIRCLDSDNGDDRAEAVCHFLWSSVFHQYTLYTATPFAIQFVIEALHSPKLAERDDGLGSPMKRELIHFVRQCAHVGQRGIHGEPDPRDPTVESAVLSGGYVYEEYINDPDDRVRSDANWLWEFCYGRPHAG